jgi:hypothetical protein
VVAGRLSVILKTLLTLLLKLLVEVVAEAALPRMKQRTIKTTVLRLAVVVLEEDIFLQLLILPKAAKLFLLVELAAAVAHMEPIRMEVMVVRAEAVM